MTLTISGKLEEQLLARAAKENQTVEDYLEGLIAQEAQFPVGIPGDLLAESLRSANFHSGRTNTSENVKAIMEAEFAGALLRRLDESNS